MYKILITGVNGFVGKYLYDQMKSSYVVYGLDLKPNTMVDRMLVCDITQSEEVRRVLEDVDIDIVIHCAALAHNDTGKLTNEDFHRVNVEGTKNLINALCFKKIQRFLLFSSVSVYGEYGCSEAITEEAETNPLTDYAKSKLDAEQLLKDQSFFKYFILRMPVIHSPEFLKDIYKRFLTRKIGPLNLILKPGSGNQVHSFCNIENLFTSIIQLIQIEDLESQKIHIADKFQYSTNDLIRYYKSDKNRIAIIPIPKMLLFCGISLVGMLKKKKNEYQSIYWKLCENNLYSTRKISSFKISSDKSIFRK